MNETLYNELLRLARSQRLTTYSDIASLVGLDMGNNEDRHKITNLLREIAVHENDAGRPMLTSLVVHKGNDNNPGEGFFSIAQEFGLFDDAKDHLARLTFWTNQVTAVHNHWKNS